MKSVVFDLDGTLADTSKDLIAAANSCFEQLGLTIMLDPINDASVAFRGGRAMLRLGLERANCLDESIIDEQYSFLLKYYEKNINVETVLYDGVCDALNELQKRGYLLGVCTNKPEFLAEKLLKSLGIREYFLITFLLKIQAYWCKLLINSLFFVAQLKHHILHHIKRFLHLYFFHNVLIKMNIVHQ